MSAFTTIVISRTNLNDTLEMFFDGESVGLITFQVRRSAVRLTIKASPNLRFIKGELPADVKAAHLNKVLPLPGRKKQQKGHK